VFNRKEGLAKAAAEMKSKTHILEILLIEGELHVEKVLPSKYPE